MIGIMFDLFPEHFWVATIALAATTPPLLLAWSRRGWQASRGFMYGAGAWVPLCGAFASIDLVWYWQLSRSGLFWGRPFALLLHVCQTCGWELLTWAGGVFGCSSLLTWLASSLFRSSAARLR
jgi:hypothetical protein